MNWSAYFDQNVTLPGTIIPGTGGYRRMTADEYHGFHAINAGLLKCRTAAEMFAKLTTPQKDTDALTIGTLAHMAYLEPETSWGTRFALADIPINDKTGRPYGEDTKKGQAAWEAARLEHPGKIIVTEETLRDYLATCKELQFALSMNADAMSELQNVETEATGILWHPRWNVWCKWRADVLPKHGRYIADVKTTSRHVADFAKDAWTYGYYTQAVWYAYCHETLLSRLKLTMTKFPFIVLSKADASRYPRPAMCRVYDLPLNPDLSSGVKNARAALGLPEGFSRVDVFVNSVREYVEAGCPEDPAKIRRCFSAYEFEAGEKGRWVLGD